MVEESKDLGIEESKGVGIEESKDVGIEESKDVGRASMPDTRTDESAPGEDNGQKFDMIFNLS